MRNFSDVVAFFVEVIAMLVPIVFGLIFLLIVWRVIDAWIIHGGDEKKVEEGKATILVGVIVLVVLSGVWGIVRLLQNSLFS